MNDEIIIMGLRTAIQSHSKKLSWIGIMTVVYFITSVLGFCSSLTFALYGNEYIPLIVSILLMPFFFGMFIYSRHLKINGVKYHSTKMWDYTQEIINIKSKTNVYVKNELI